MHCGFLSRHVSTLAHSCARREVVHRLRLDDWFHGHDADRRGGRDSVGSLAQLAPWQVVRWRASMARPSGRATVTISLMYGTFYFSRATF